MYTRRARAAKAERREHALVVNARAVEEEFCLEERERERQNISKRISTRIVPPQNIVKSRLSKKKKKKKKKTKKKDKNDDDDITERVAND